jgi:hypothetical protein
METIKYQFDTQNHIGKSGEHYIDKWLRHTYKIIDVSCISRYQKAGIDRIVTRPDGSNVTLEYKVDFTAKRTGNIFFETVSNDKKEIPGWGWTSQADYWIFLIPKQELIIFKPGNLRNLVWGLKESLNKKIVPNTDYNTIGYPIPLKDARSISFRSKYIS